MEGDRRATRMAEVRESLAEAALLLFLERGFDAVTVDEIVEAAGVSRRSFFRYFPTKESVVLARRRRQLAALVAMLGAEVPGETPLGAVRRASLALARDFRANRARILREQRLVAEHAGLFARDLEVDFEYESAVAAALASRMGGRSKRHAHWLAAAIVGVLRTVLREWGEGGGKGDLDAMVRKAFDFLDRLGGVTIQ